MLVFPQLNTGASATYPFTRVNVKRTIVNQLTDGRTDVFSDAAGASLLWVLPARGLTRSELDAIEALFIQTRGRLATFTFLDPVSNLLSYSETFTQTNWTQDPLVQLIAGITDPAGTATGTALINTAPTVSGITQSVTIPHRFHYCLSAWMRSSAAASARLSIIAGTASITKSFNVTSQWTQQYISGAPAVTNGSGIQVSIKTVPGSTIELYGVQLEPQLAPSNYKMTTSQGGVYSKARFAADELTSTAQESDVFDAVIRIVTTGS